MIGCGEGVILGMMTGVVLGLCVALMILFVVEGREAERTERDKLP